MDSEILLKAKEMFGVTTKIKRVTEGFQNIVYSYGEGGREKYLRITPAKLRNMNLIASEIAFILALHDGGIPVSLPVKSAAGNFIETVHHKWGPYHLVSFEAASGCPVDVTQPDIWNKGLFNKWGRMMGNMHKIAANNVKRDLVRPVGLEADASIFCGVCPFVPDIIREKYQEHLKVLSDLSRTPDLFGLMHNDFHQGNFRVESGEITLFDFDDCAYYWYANDIAASFYHANWQNTSFNGKNEKFTELFFYEFFDGYTKEFTLHKEMTEQIPLFLKHREFFLLDLFTKNWDIDQLETWQSYTLKDLKERIEQEKPVIDQLLL
ncbi:phosphotransferase enzyme family protein [Peribacillus deserti]|uniref:Aminoglycoside phosphotransferase domain-containing protein n=1 Tax=Peribacillus deserti TaxID=673318 RepID=A0A2N5M8L6_9BACI|nr:phosphotransferase [Peribacillus deserti]PLT30685.1 hypothetical protein CUU66_05895 [Peribacillus deserti]